MIDTVAGMHGYAVGQVKRCAGDGLRPIRHALLGVVRNGIRSRDRAGVGRVRLACRHGVMSALRTFGRVTGWTCMAIGGIQLLGGVRWEPGIAGHATVDSHVRFMGPVFAGYGLGWFDATAAPDPDLGRMRVLAGLMALGGVGRLATRATLGRPHRFHDLLLAVELAAPAVVEALARRERPTG